MLTWMISSPTSNWIPLVGKSQNEMSLLTFEKSKQYANKKYKENEEGIHSGKLNYMFLEISKEVRRKIQPIGK